jgi:hypothetical protein
MATYEQQTFLESDPLLYSAPASHVSQQALPGNEKAKTMCVGSGRQCAMLLDQSGPLGVFSKILLESSLFGNSKQFSYAWRILDTKFGCSAFQLTQLAQITSDNGSSLWPTAHANCHTGAGEHGTGAINLQTAAKLWPTPTTRDHKDGTAESCANVPVNGLLGRMVHQLLPTLQAHDAAKGDSARVNRFGTEHGGRNLNDTIGGSLNPRFVEQLMGYEIDHTALKDLATRSFRNKSTRSSKQSPK